MIAFLTAVVAANVAAAPATRPVDPAALAAATALVQTLDVRGQVMRSMTQNIQTMKSGVALRAMLAQQPGFVQAYQANKARFDPALQKAGAIQGGIAEKVVRENIGAVVGAATRVYARSFTVAELNGLLAFYRTPLGQSLNQKGPRLSAEIGAASGKIIGAKIDAAMQAAAPQLQAVLAPLNSTNKPKT